MRSLLIIAVLALFVPAPANAEPAKGRQGQLLHLLKQDCGSCHGLTMKGGLGPALTPAALQGKADDLLAETILGGRPGTPMPPWAFEIKPEEALWLIHRLRTGDLGDGR